MNRVPAMTVLVTLALGAIPLHSQPQPPDARSRPPTSQEAVDLLKAICPDRIRTQHSVSIYSYLACKGCPAHTTTGRLRRASKTYFDLHTVIFGSFTAPGLEEAVADLYSCEEHTTTANFHSSVRLRKEPKGWRMISYERVETSQCQTYRLPDGRDLLLCRGWTGHPDISASWIFIYDFLPTASQLERDVFGAVNTWGACRSAAIAGPIDSYDLCDLDQDGMRDLRIYLSVIKGQASRESGVCAADFSPPPAENYHIDFLFKDDAFVVAPWSAETKRALDELFNKANRF